MCAYFFAEQFFGIQKERNRLFHQLGFLTSDLNRLKPLGKIGESASFISHEIKNYVSVLRSNNLLLQSKFKESDAPEMDRISRSTERLEQFAKSILDYSQTSESAAFTPIELDEIVFEAIRNSFGEQTSFFQVKQNGKATILGDPIRLDRAFTNLFKNSLEADANEIRISFSENNGKVSVQIEDNGSGCSDENLKFLGSLFLRPRNTKAEPDWDWP
jgi:signal transduction histidine kinase